MDVAVIGAGAAGFLAAYFSAGPARRVALFEATRDGGRKILISGGGRCNVLPSEVEPAWFVTASSRNSLRNILRTWPLADQRRFFEEELGLPLAVEAETGKLFPVSNRAREVRDRLVTAVRSRGVDLRFGSRLEGLRREAGGWALEFDSGASVAARTVILATGGLSVPTTGSDGLGLRLARELGHAMHATYPALTPLTTQDARWTSLAGISLDVLLSAPPETPAYQRRQGFLFTHRGFSGPSVLNLSHVFARSREGARPPLLAAWGGRAREDWDAELSAGGRAQVGTVLRRQLPERLALALLDLAGVEPDRPLAQLKREERDRLLRQLTACELAVSGDEGYRKAEVTGGGVALSEIDPVTMESRRAPGLFLCGELLDAFGPIGGYNFHWAWATGRAAGLGAAARLAR